MKKLIYISVAMSLLGSAFPGFSLAQMSGFITITSPNGGETLTIGQTYRIKWTSSSNIDKVSVYSSVNEYSADPIVSNIQNTGSYDWVVDVGRTTNTQFKILIYGYQTGVGNVQDTSNNFFTVTGTLPPPPPPNPPPPPPTSNGISIHVTLPNGGEQWAKGTVKRITWTSSSDIDKVSIDWATGPFSANHIATAIPNVGYYDWLVNTGSTSSGTNIKIRVMGPAPASGGNPFDESDNYFITTEPGSEYQAPVITSTNSTGMITPGVNVVVNGQNFDSSSYIELDGSQSINPYYFSATSLSFTLPSNVGVGSHTIRVGEKASNIKSNQVTITVVAYSTTTPYISGVDSTGMITPGVRVVVYGSSFDQASYIDFDGTQSINPVSFSGSTSLVFIVPSNATPGSHTIRVREKASDVKSNLVSFSVGALTQFTVTFPTSDSILKTGQTYALTWNADASSEGVESYTIYLNGGPANISKYLGTVPVRQYAFQWTVPSTIKAGSGYRINFSAKAAGGTSQSFAITGSENVAPSPTPTTSSLPADTDTESSQCLSLQSNLRYRSRDIGTNGEVSALQDFLQANKYLSSEPTGFFGIVTLKAVKDFQQANGIAPTGFVGAFTRAKIKTLTCG